MIMSLLTCRRIASTIFQTSCDFDAKPMVMLLGQYSTGKTTFIKHLLKTSYPGSMLYLIQQIGVLTLSIPSVLELISFDCIEINFTWLFSIAGAHVGPEPTTDKFVVVMVNTSMNIVFSFRMDVVPDRWSKL